MAHLIDKDALVAKIKKIDYYAQTMSDNAINGSMRQFYDGMKQGCVDLLSFLDSLEVTEVDLEKEIDFAMPSKYCWSGDGKAVYSKEQMRNFAKHFFELGMSVSNKAQKGE